MAWGPGLGGIVQVPTQHCAASFNLDRRVPGGKSVRYALADESIHGFQGTGVTTDMTTMGRQRTGSFCCASIDLFSSVSHLCSLKHSSVGLLILIKKKLLWDIRTAFDALIDSGIGFIDTAEGEAFALAW